MTSEALYERYKDALKRGHVASLRGRVDDALLAYAEAASIAPERATPHASAGTALLRRKRPAEALRHYEVALSIAPRDETALLGRAQALAALDRRGEAADAFDTLADVQAGSGRLADAVDAARRGLELAEGRERRRTLERLISRLRSTEPDEPGRVALERALQVLDGPAVPQGRAAHHAPGSGKAPEAAGAARESDRDHEEAEGGPDGASPRGGAADDAGVTAQAAAEPGGAEPAAVEMAGGEIAMAEAGGVTQAAVEAGGASEPLEVEATGGEAASTDETAEEEALEKAPASPLGKIGRVVPAGVTADELAARAEAASDGADPAAALDALLDLAAAQAANGRIDAALDACYAALSFDPDHVGLHLALVELYGMRGWDSLASEKLVLLERLARLDDDDAALSAIAGARSGRA